MDYIIHQNFLFWQDFLVFREQNCLFRKFPFLVSRSCDFPKKEILMADISNFLVINFQKTNLMD